MCIWSLRLLPFPYIRFSCDRLSAIWIWACMGAIGKRQYLCLYPCVRVQWVDYCRFGRRCKSLSVLHLRIMSLRLGNRWLDGVSPFVEAIFFFFLLGLVFFPITPVMSFLFRSRKLSISLSFVAVWHDMALEGDGIFIQRYNLIYLRRCVAISKWRTCWWQPQRRNGKTNG